MKGVNATNFYLMLKDGSELSKDEVYEWFGAKTQLDKQAILKMAEILRDSGKIETVPGDKTRIRLTLDEVLR